MMIVLVRAAQAFQQRRSTLLAIGDPLLALNLDLAAALVLTRAQREAEEEREIESRYL